jgi:hypothetical protein
VLNIKNSHSCGIISAIEFEFLVEREVGELRGKNQKHERSLDLVKRYPFFLPQEHKGNNTTHNVIANKEVMTPTPSESGSASSGMPLRPALKPEGSVDGGEPMSPKSGPKGTFTFMGGGSAGVFVRESTSKYLYSLPMSWGHRFV